jgi:hypothetical protein
MQVESMPGESCAQEIEEVRGKNTSKKRCNVLSSVT